MRARDRFYRSYAVFVGADGVKRDADVYSYESHTTLYDVVVIRGAQLVRVNNGDLSPLICDWKRAHYEIAHHFGLCVGHKQRKEERHAV